jgi:hypothetical protein
MKENVQLHTYKPCSRRLMGRAIQAITRSFEATVFICRRRVLWQAISGAFDITMCITLPSFSGISTYRMALPLMPTPAWVGWKRATSIIIDRRLSEVLVIVWEGARCFWAIRGNTGLSALFEV